MKGLPSNWWFWRWRQRSFSWAAADASAHLAFPMGRGVLKEGGGRRKEDLFYSSKQKRKEGFYFQQPPQCDFAPTVFLAVSLPLSLSIYFLCMYVYTSVVTAPRGIEYKLPASYTWRKEENRKRLTAAVINMGNVFMHCWFLCMTPQHPGNRFIMSRAAKANDLISTQPTPTSPFSPRLLPWRSKRRMSHTPPRFPRLQ